MFHDQRRSFKASSTPIGACQLAAASMPPPSTPMDAVVQRKRANDAKHPQRIDRIWFAAQVLDVDVRKGHRV